MINAEKLTFGFNSTLLLQNVSFTLEENCHCALIGSNGTGKTTLTNLIRQPDRYIFDGKLKLEGVGRIGYVSQFALREGNQTVTVYDYLCRDFLALEQEMQKRNWKPVLPAAWKMGIGQKPSACAASWRWLWNICNKNPILSYFARFSKGLSLLFVIYLYILLLKTGLQHVPNPGNQPRRSL